MMSWDGDCQTVGAGTSRSAKAAELAKIRIVRVIPVRRRDIIFLLAVWLPSGTRCRCRATIPDGWYFGTREQ
jgi:hypothetical protein